MIFNKHVWATLTITLVLLGGCTMHKHASLSSQPSKLIGDTAHISRTSYLITKMSTDEKRTLKRIVQELKDLHNLIDEAEFRANPDSRFRFNYQRLRYDLSLVAAAIQAHVNKPDHSPRSIDAIPGNFR